MTNFTLKLATPLLSKQHLALGDWAIHRESESFRRCEGMVADGDRPAPGGKGAARLWIVVVKVLRLL